MDPQTSNYKLTRTSIAQGGCVIVCVCSLCHAARGIGIRVVHQWKQIPKKRPIVVQK